MLSEDVLEAVRDTIYLRCKLLLYLYTQFLLSSSIEHGSCKPVMRPLWYQDPCGRHESRNESSYFYGDSIIVSPLQNNIGNIKTCFEFDELGNVVHAKVIDKAPKVRVQIAQGKIIPVISFTRAQLADELQSTKLITDNLKDLKLDILVFPHKFDIKNASSAQCLADGFIYIDDMLTHRYAEKSEYLLLKIRLIGD